jgi:hypothetical protein
MSLGFLAAGTLFFAGFGGEEEGGFEVAGEGLGAEGGDELVALGIGALLQFVRVARGGRRSGSLRGRVLRRRREVKSEGSSGGGERGAA